MKNSCRLLNALILFGDFWTVREGSLWSLFFWDNCIPTPNLGKRTVALTVHIFSQLQVASPQKSNFGFARLLEEAFLTRHSCQLEWKHWLDIAYQLFFPNLAFASTIMIIVYSGRKVSPAREDSIQWAHQKRTPKLREEKVNLETKKVYMQPFSNKVYDPVYPLKGR